MSAGTTKVETFDYVALVDSNGNVTAPAAVGSGATSTSSSPEYAKSVGSSNINTGQVAVTTSATLVVAARAGRAKVTLTPTTSVVYYVGGSGVSTTTGAYVPAGSSITLDTAAAVYAVGASAVTMSFIEFY